MEGKKLFSEGKTEEAKMYKAILIIQKIRTSTGIQSRPS
jgi:hypothetical protein